jgi:hypothetical protein
MKAASVTLLCLSFLAAAYAVTPEGAVVQHVTIQDATATITVLNQSQHGITGFTLGIDTTMPDGKVDHSEYTTDYGPRGKTLLPHQTEDVKYPAASVDVKAKVVVAIYSDGTAETEKKATLDQILSVREEAVRDLKLTPNEIKTYVNVRRLP